MKIAIMQPYFFPYLGYFGLIKHTDKWIVLDVVQFIRHGWIERNRILKPTDGWQYVCVPLEQHKRDTLIKDIEIRQTENWKQKILSQLIHYKKKAPFYNSVIDFLNDCFKYDTNNISLLDSYLLKRTCDYLQMDFNYEIYSEMNLSIEPICAPGDWALYISKALGATEYINLPGGIELFDKNNFEDHGIKLTFFNINIKEYNQKSSNFEKGLSILDVMMFNSPETIQEMLNQFELL